MTRFVICLPLHLFFLVSQESNSLAFTPVDRDWLWLALSKRKVTLAHLEDGKSWGAVTLTASSRELKKFVRKYADDKAVFNPDSDLTFRFKRR